MPKGARTVSVLADASRKERRCAWVEAALLYEDLAASSRPSMAAELREKIALCYHRAAFQSRGPDEFRGRIQQSITAYHEAAELYEKVRSPTREAKAIHCRAMVEFNKGWISKGYKERKEALQRYEALEREALRIFQTRRDHCNTGKSCIELTTSLLEQDLLEAGWEGRRKRLEEAQALVEKAISILSELRQTKDLVSAYCKAALVYKFLPEVYSSEEKVRQLVRKSVEYAEKAVELAAKAKDVYLLGSSYYVSGEAYEKLGDVSTSLSRYDHQLEYGRKANDNFLTGWALCNISNGLYWQMMVESDPIKRKEGYERSIEFAENGAKHLSLASYEAGVSCSYVHYAESCLTLARESIATAEDTHSLLQKAVEIAKIDLQHVDESGQPRFQSAVRNCLSKTLYYLATIETEPQHKVALLNEASRMREERMKIAGSYFPFRYWERSEDQSSLAMIKSELAKVEVDPNKKTGLLRSAIENMESCLQYCSKAVESVQPTRKHQMVQKQAKELMAGTARYYDVYSKIINQLFQLSGEDALIAKLEEVYNGAVNCYTGIALPARAAEAYWGLGEFHLRLGENAKAQENFWAAAESYKKASQQIPQLRELYEDYASYMEAWTRISAAKFNHTSEEYDKATRNYGEAANRLSTSRRWSYLSDNYQALAAVEGAEHLSRGEKAEEAIEEFRRASGLVEDSRQKLEQKIAQTESPEEREGARALAEAALLRRQYCQARILLEEAKLAYRSGDMPLSIRQYASASEILEKVAAALQTEWEKREIEAIASSCRAWQKMQEAETKASAELYSVAAQLFMKSHEAAKQRAALVARGNANYCMALSSSLQFKETWRIDDYMTAKSHLADAAELYSKAGFPTAAEWARATERMLDAYVYINNALKDTDPEKRARNYLAAEKVLELSASIYEKAGYPTRRDEILLSLKKVKDEREFALSLMEVFIAPTIVSSTASFSIPTPGREQPVGLSEFQAANVQITANMPSEVRVGEEFQVKIDLINTGKEPATLHKIENILPKGLITSKEQTPTAEHGVLEFHGRRLQPLQIESISFSVKSNEAGEIKFSPKVSYSDESGRLLTNALGPIRILVHPSLEFRFKNDKTSTLFNHLVDAFVKDYMVRKFHPERSGWRSLVEIARDARIPISTVYGRKGGIGPVLEELTKRGLVETRIFPGERGRGGEVMRLRIAYEKEPIKEYVNQTVRIKT